jgi:hypothetical protein
MVRDFVIMMEHIVVVRRPEHVWIREWELRANSQKSIARPSPCGRDEIMADFLLGNLGDWLNRLSGADSFEQQEAHATLVASVSRHHCLACTALKPDPSASAGIALSRSHFLNEAERHVSSYISVSKMTDDSLFAGTGMMIGMQVCSINNQVPRSPGEAAQIIRQADRVVTMVVHRPDHAGIMSQTVGASLVAATVELERTAADLLRDISFKSLPLTTDLVYISSIVPYSPLDRHDPPLRSGMIVYSINNVRVRSVAEALACIQSARNVVTIMAETMQTDFNHDASVSSRNSMINSLPLAEVIIPAASATTNSATDNEMDAGEQYDGNNTVVDAVRAIPAAAAAAMDLEHYVLPATALIATTRHDIDVVADAPPPPPPRQASSAVPEMTRDGEARHDNDNITDNNNNDFDSVSSDVGVVEMGNVPSAGSSEDDHRAASSSTTTRAVDVVGHETAAVMMANNAIESCHRNIVINDDELLPSSSSSSSSTGSERNVDYERGGHADAAAAAHVEEEEAEFASETCFEV